MYQIIQIECKSDQDWLNNQSLNLMNGSTVKVSEEDNKN